MGGSPNIDVKAKIPLGWLLGIVAGIGVFGNQAVEVGKNAFGIGQKTPIEVSMPELDVVVNKAMEPIQTTVQAIADAQSSHIQIPMHDGAQDSFLIEDFKYDELKKVVDEAVVIQNEMQIQLMTIETEGSDAHNVVDANSNAIEANSRAIETVDEKASEIIELLIERVIKPAEEAAAEGASP